MWKWVDVYKTGGSPVTPFIEYTPSLDRYYWLNKELPRVMSPDELNEFLESDVLAKSPADLYNIIEL